MASEHSSLEPALHKMTPAIISSGLMPNPPPSKLPKVIAPIAEVVAPDPAGSTGSLEMDIQEKYKNRSQIDKTEHENGKSVKEK
ncbi:hypothetical protein Tco_1049006 [Tanacetum coccineum]